MIHPELGELIGERPPPEVVVHLMRCPRCRRDRAAWCDSVELPDPALAIVPDPGPRFELTGWLGRGGMGEVFLARDLVLGREVALKVLRSDRDRADLAERLVREANLTARLEHPAIAPVYASGLLADGRPFYTMKVVRGQTLRGLLGGADGEPLALRRAIDLLQRVCDVVGFAHERGIVHRDLKPENVMLGAYGELTLVDFGLSSEIERPIDTLAGTAAYLAPELLGGGAALPAADVYALGAMLYEMLTGAPPHLAVSEVLELPPDTPAELASSCRAALARDPAVRPAAPALGEQLRDWLDGVRRLEESREIAAAAESLGLQATRARADAAALRSRATMVLASLEVDAPPESRSAAWELEDAAAALLLAADTLDARYEQRLSAAIARSPELPEVRRALAEHWRRRLLDAEGRRDTREAARYDAIIREDGTLAAWLDAEVPVQVVTDPPGLRVVAERLAPRGRRLVPIEAVELGVTPVCASLPPGSWRLSLGDDPRHVVALWLERGGADPGVDPEGVVAVHRLPTRFDDEDCWVPAGRAVIGGDAYAPDAFPRLQVWVAAFVIRRFAVTVGEFLAFLDDLCADGRPDEAHRHVPRAPGPVSTQGTVLVSPRSPCDRTSRRASTSA